MNLDLRERQARSKRELHPEALDQEGPLVGGFFDDFARRFSGAVAGASFDAERIGS
jgi:hypothetical protein